MRKMWEIFELVNITNMCSYILPRNIYSVFYIDSEDAADCIMDDKNCIEHPTEFNGAEEISNRVEKTKRENSCFPFRVGDDKLKGR